MPNKLIQYFEAHSGMEFNVENILKYLDDNSWDYSDTVELDGKYTFDELEALVLAARKQGYLSND